VCIADPAGQEVEALVRGGKVLVEVEIVVGLEITRDIGRCAGVEANVLIDVRAGLATSDVGGVGTKVNIAVGFLVNP
jgi:hypothetical protein